LARWGLQARSDGECCASALGFHRQEVTSSRQPALGAHDDVTGSGGNRDELDGHVPVVPHVDPDGLLFASWAVKTKGRLDPLCLLPHPTTTMFASLLNRELRSTLHSAARRAKSAIRQRSLQNNRA
jgi:hypothetical protein